MGGGEIRGPMGGGDKGANGRGRGRDKGANGRGRGR